METIGSRIKKLRKEKKLTQGKLGDLVGVSDVTIGFWEKDVNEPKYENLETLSKMLDTTVHGDIRHLEMNNLICFRIAYVHGDIRHLEKINTVLDLH